MNILDAAHKTVHAYPGGSESLAPRIGMSAAVLRNKVNPNNTTHHLTLAEADEVMGVTGDHRLLQVLAANHGYALQRCEAVHENGPVLQALLVANAAEGEFDRVLQEALSDNLITQNELRLIESAGLHQQAALMGLLNRLRAFAAGQVGG